MNNLSIQFQAHYCTALCSQLELMAFMTNVQQRYEQNREVILGLNLLYFFIQISTVQSGISPPPLTDSDPHNPLPYPLPIYYSSYETLNW